MEPLQVVEVVMEVEEAVMEAEEVVMEVGEVAMGVEEVALEVVGAVEEEFLRPVDMELLEEALEVEGKEVLL